ncbi:hypothetical protein [Kushneria avicenniae]|uniref:hypothetical protein n=1 Tax=Kushneria avicenniae TaxID=402385 RepID=UPI0011136612|nr:hypothetical protein [Kushneria avicenniae]
MYRTKISCRLLLIKSKKSFEIQRSSYNRHNHHALHYSSTGLSDGLQKVMKCNYAQALENPAMTPEIAVSGGSLLGERPIGRSSLFYKKLIKQRFKASRPDRHQHFKCSLFDI